MNDLTLDELNTLLAVFERANVVEGEGAEGSLMARLRVSRDERAELESMDFDDCLGGACKL
ncbi:hypothetical protein GCM10011348_10920 [Marinobacterium nitratireducens]|uniref:Uncharacterized protein n=1 Tax=Marinobacterium nitratireducens TaxID=518897 RepID=A0A918DPP1_9GAMM|nr:hypothetical protein [Marinobacterium nitratireducens]GGO78605.1 hypothetical protein GCM10011348_10920 [Marinobacterium nitratireducens]